jgi:hypothetical protein
LNSAEKSLAWESFEQSSFWELLRSDVVNSQKLFDWAFDLLDDVDWNGWLPWVGAVSANIVFNRSRWSAFFQST